MSTAATLNPDGFAVGVAEMVRLTGVKAERLRSWERRHDFPQTQRLPNGHRCYSPTEVQRVIAVSHAVQSGIRLEDAIDEVITGVAPMSGGGATVIDEAEMMLGAAPNPAMLVAGGHRLRIVWQNSALAAAGVDEGLAVDLLTASSEEGGSSGHQALLSVLNGTRVSAVVEHDDWLAPLRRPARSSVWRPRARSTEPVAILAQLLDSGPGFPRLGVALEGNNDRRAWVDAVRDAREALWSCTA